MPVDANGLQVLSAEQSLALVSRHLPHVGRVALPADDGPIVLPINYRVVDDTVVFRTGPGSQLASAAGGVPVAFEVDEVDEAWEEGWSVLVRGRAVEVTEPDELARLQRLPLRAWASGAKTRYIKIVPSEITGRRIG
jgi:nitroimidazol reductase NimA-like FMN-containing flavoprotein (pyridoxamine 5'-phosphate oxidase superfamily)